MFKNQSIIFGLLACSVALTACNEKPQQEEAQTEQSVEQTQSDTTTDVSSVQVFDPDSPEAKVDAEQQY